MQKFSVHNALDVSSFAPTHTSPYDHIREMVSFSRNGLTPLSQISYHSYSFNPISTNALQALRAFAGAVFACAIHVISRFLLSLSPPLFITLTVPDVSALCLGLGRSST